jgi:anti-sigma regulatory factor (Ser/Thr protein kinase)/CheY-like chemotaxis protein
MTNVKLEAHSPRLLLVDGQLNQTGDLVQALRDNGMEVEVTDSAQEALNALQQCYRDVLLLEVPSPDMPAAQMVALTRNRFPFLPVIVLSDQKRMNEAIGALNAGAMHLIPLPCPAKQAISALRKILGFHQELLAPRVFPKLTQTVRFELPSSLDYVTGAANQLTEMLVRFGIISLEEINLKIALVEALTNAMEHGHGFNAQLRVKVEAKIDERRGEIKITDHGKGFNHHHLPDPTAPENLYKPRGRGIYMMYRLMDEVHFNRKGNSVRLVKYRRGASSTAE